MSQTGLEFGLLLAFTQPAAILPNSACRPVVTTTPSPSPLHTTVPMKTHDDRSASAQSDDRRDRLVGG